MNPHTIRRLFPHASQSLIAANEQDYGKPYIESDGQIAKLERPTCDELKTIDEPEQINYLRLMKMDIEKLYECYLRVGSLHKAGREFDVCGETVRRLLKEAQKPLNRTKWTEEELSSIRCAYSSPTGFDSFILAKTINRTVAAIYCKADAMGLCGNRGKHIRTARARQNMSAAQKEVSAREGVVESRAKAVSEAFKKNGHPRGFLGHKRKPEEIEKMKQASKAAWADPSHKVNSEEYRQSISDRTSKSAATRPKENAYSNAKSGWVELSGKRFFARSQWEANYGRFLEWQKQQNQIADWEHEPHTFWFDKIKRGVRSYLPDFRVVLKSGAIEWHEVKGWMDAKSKTKIKRMAKYYPNEVLRIFGESWFKDANKTLFAIVPEWQSNAKPKKAKRSIL